MAKEVLKNIGIGLIFTLGLIVLLYNIYMLPSIKNHYPRLADHIQAIIYEQKAKDFPPSDYAAKRYRAMAESLRQGSHDYKFETGPVPTMK
jgi:hypothetical protein